MCKICTLELPFYKFSEIKNVKNDILYLKYKNNFCKTHIKVEKV